MYASSFTSDSLGYLVVKFGNCSNNEPVVVEIDRQYLLGRPEPNLDLNPNEIVLFSST
jgi:hypothetical protein